MVYWNHETTERAGGNSMEDKIIECRDCGNEFVFTVGEQEFYQEKGFTNDPVRCKDCRQKRKQERNDYNNNREF